MYPLRNPPFCPSSSLIAAKQNKQKQWSVQPHLSANRCVRLQRGAYVWLWTFAKHVRELCGIFHFSLVLLFSNPAHLQNFEAQLQKTQSTEFHPSPSLWRKMWMSTTIGNFDRGPVTLKRPLACRATTAGLFILKTKSVCLILIVWLVKSVCVTRRSRSLRGF